MPRSLIELDARRVALVKPSALGDIVHSLPVLHALRVRFPKAHLTWVVNRGFAPLLNGHPDLDDILPFDRRRLVALPSFVRELYRRRFDLVIDLQGLLRTGLMCAATGASRRVGLSTAREGSRAFYSDLVRDTNEMHAVDRYWLVSQALGVGDLPKVFHVPLAPAALAWANEVLRRLPRPWLVVAPGSRWETKRWPHFGELLCRAQMRYGGTAVAIGSADEVALTSVLPALNLAGRTTLPQVAALLSLADVVLANDSGPLHLAAALGRPVVAPYTCTTVRKHGPYGQNGVESSVECAGSYRKRCEHRTCMTDLTPDRLWPLLDETLSRWQNRSRSA